jgi:aryl-alcohol dehydrogenase-like predicted oxidoreductase
VALNWVIAKGAVPIPGVKNRRQAQDVLGTLEWRLLPEEVAALDAASDDVNKP